MASDRASETRKIAATTTVKQEDFVTGCKGACVSADADCFIAFDENADLGSFFIQADTNTGFIPVQFTKFSVVAASTANVYILAIR
ncbi:MAG: hypothetical protein AAB922_01225 [Patescibacteria group bacterium]